MGNDASKFAFRFLLLVPFRWQLLIFNIDIIDAIQDVDVNLRRIGSSTNTVRSILPVWENKRIYLFKLCIARSQRCVDDHCHIERTYTKCPIMNRTIHGVLLR